MSSSPVRDDSELVGRALDCLDNISWSVLYQEILQSGGVPDQNINHVNDQEVDSDNNGLELGKSCSPKSMAPTKKRKMSSKINENGGLEGPSVAKKMDHNARERIRRMKLNASYLALRALLPHHSRRSKKRSWSAPAIVDGVLKYIPELENEIQAMRSHKENIQPKNNKINPAGSEGRPTVSVNRVNEGEAIVQICMDNELRFTSLLQSMEDEGICINSASEAYICHTTICYHLHVQVNTSSGADCYLDELRDKVIAWLR